MNSFSSLLIILCIQFGVCAVMLAAIWMGIKKDDQWRDKYLKMAKSIPFDNDPLRMVVMAFRTLYPDKQFRAQIAEELCDESGKTVYGETVFPDDGGCAEIIVAGNIPYQSVVEVLAHELAHVAAGCDSEHGEAWEAAFDAIYQEYNAIGNRHIKERMESQQNTIER